MNPKSSWQQLTLLFAICVAGYFVAFYGIEHFRGHSGPWEVTFTTETGTPTLVINQPKLKIQNLKLTFPGNPPTAPAAQTVKFDFVRPVPFAVPFGQCVFHDTISLPGNVTLQILGHEIQLLPRVLTIDKSEIPWKSDTTLPIPPK